MQILYPCVIKELLRRYNKATTPCYSNSDDKYSHLFYSAPPLSVHIMLYNDIQRRQLSESSNPQSGTLKKMKIMFFGWNCLNLTAEMQILIEVNIIIDIWKRWKAGQFSPNSLKPAAVKYANLEWFLSEWLDSTKLSCVVKKTNGRENEGSSRMWVYNQG